MIIQMTAQFHSNGRDDAVAQAEEAWRSFIGDPQAALPWATTLNVQIESAALARPYIVDLVIKETRAESALTSGG